MSDDKKGDTACSLCGEPLPPGEEMFKYHVYSGPCPKPLVPDAGTFYVGEISALRVEGIENWIQGLLPVHGDDARLLMVDTKTGAVFVVRRVK